MCNQNASCCIRQLAYDPEHPAVLSRVAYTTISHSVRTMDAAVGECCAPVQSRSRTGRRGQRRMLRRSQTQKLFRTLILSLYIAMSCTPSVESKALGQPLCIDQKLQNPCQTPANGTGQTFVPRGDKLKAVLSVANSTLNQSAARIDQYIRIRWQPNYNNMTELDNEWNNVLTNANKSPLPDGHQTLDQLLVFANDRIQRSMIAFENFRRTKYPDNSNAPYVLFDKLQEYLVCLLCEVRALMGRQNIPINVLEYEQKETDLHYKLNEYIELKTFLSETAYFRDRLQALQHV